MLTEDGLLSQLEYEVVYWDEKNPRSLINLVTGNQKEILERKQVKENLLLDELAHQKIVKPTVKVNQLRLSFWKEFERVASMEKPTKMLMKNVYRGIANRDYFFDTCKDEKKFSWILRPPTTYITQCEEALQKSMGRIREILEFPLWEKKEIKKKSGGTYNKQVPNVKVAELMLKVHDKLEQRVMGAVVQKTKAENVFKRIEEQRMLLVQQTQAANAAKDIEAEVVETRSAAEIQAEIEKIRGSSGNKTMSNLKDTGFKEEDDGSSEK